MKLCSVENENDRQYDDDAQRVMDKLAPERRKRQTVCDKFTYPQSDMAEAHEDHGVFAYVLKCAAYRLH